MSLSEEEQRSLAEIEAVLRRESPALAAALTPARAGHSRSRIAVGAVLCLVAPLVLVVQIALHDLAMIALMIGVSSLLTMMMAIVVWVLQRLRPGS